MADANGTQPATNSHAIPPQAARIDLDEEWKAIRNRFVEEQLARQEELTRNAYEFSRQWFAAQTDRQRDLFTDCGYPSEHGETPDMYRFLYEREPLATRAVELYPKECWGVTPSIYEDPDSSTVTDFEEAVDGLGALLQGQASWFMEEEGSLIWQYMQRADTLSRIGSFGVLLYGFDDGKNLQEPVDGVLVVNSFGERFHDHVMTREEEIKLRDPQPRWKANDTSDMPPGRGIPTKGDGLGSAPLTENEVLVMNQWIIERDLRNKGVEPSLATNMAKARLAKQFGHRLVVNALGSYDKRTVPRDRGMHVPNEPSQTRATPLDPTKDDPLNPPMRSNQPVEVYGTDQQYDDIGYGLGMPPPAAELGYSLSGTDEQYFGVQFGPSEQPAPPTDPGTFLNDQGQVSIDDQQGATGGREGPVAGQQRQQAGMRQRPRLLFLRPFDETLVQIVRYEWNIRNPRFGLPVMYRITLNDPRDVHSGVGLPLATVFVHWSRVLHIAETNKCGGTSSSEIFAVPVLRPLLNPILDSQKVCGAGAEGYYQSCFDGDTKFFDGHALRKMKDCVDKNVLVTCADGKKREATVKAFGTRRFVRIGLAPAKGKDGHLLKFRRFVTATRDHRWVLENGTVTTTLKPGDVLAANHFPEQEELPHDPWGFAHGVVFGDGWTENKERGKGLFTVRLHGKKAWMLDRLKDVANIVHLGGTTKETKDGNPLVRFKNRETNMKALPDPDKHSEAYIASFIKGWLATDGHDCQRGNGQMGLSSSKPAAIEWFLANAPYYGYEILGLNTLTKPTSYGERGYPLHMIRYRKARRGYLVASITDEGLVGESYCVVEPVTKSFTLEGGVVTGNCFTTLQFSTHPEMGGDAIIDEQAVKQAAENVRTRLRRDLLGIGGTWSTLAPSVVDPTPHHNIAVEKICIVLACPIRIFKGSERGELASSQDDESWNRRKKERQLGYQTPRMIVPFIDRLIQVGVLPAPGQKDSVSKVDNIRRMQPWVQVKRVGNGWMVRNFRRDRHGKPINVNAVPVSVGDNASRVAQAQQMRKDNQQRPGAVKQGQAATGQAGGSDGFPIKCPEEDESDDVEQDLARNGWVTLESGQHVFIGGDNSLNPSGPKASKASGTSGKGKQSKRTAVADKSGTNKQQPSQQPMTPDDVEQHYDNWSKGLSKSAVSALASYTAGSEKYNGPLRHPERAWDRPNDPDYFKNVKANIDTLKKTIDSAPPLPAPTMVHRGIGAGPESKGLNKLLDSMQPGMVYQDKGLVSTSTDEGISELYTSDENHVMMHITLPAGTKAAYIGQHGVREMLLAPNTKIRVVKREGNTVHAEVVNDK